jgi:hypothetical protein
MNRTSRSSLAAWKARRARARLARLVRRHQRGAAMVEALVAIPFFIVIFACTMFVGSFYQEKMRTLADSKRCAWDHSINGCQGGCAADTSADGSSSQLTPSNSTGNTQTNSAPGSQIMSADFYQSKFTVQSKTTASSAIGGYVKQISSTTTVMCDEVPEDGDPAVLAKYLWNNGSSW